MDEVIRVRVQLRYASGYRSWQTRYRCKCHDDVIVYVNRHPFICYIQFAQPSDRKTHTTSRGVTPPGGPPQTTVWCLVLCSCGCGCADLCSNSKGHVESNP